MMTSAEVLVRGTQGLPPNLMLDVWATSLVDCSKGINLMLPRESEGCAHSTSSTFGSGVDSGA